jgi:hypothetical protein
MVMRWSHRSVSDISVPTASTTSARSMMAMEASLGSSAPALSGWRSGSTPLAAIVVKTTAPMLGDRPTLGQLNRAPPPTMITGRAASAKNAAALAISLRVRMRRLPPVLPTSPGRQAI